MPYIGNPIYQSAFVTDQFSGTGSATAFTMSVAPAGTTNVLVAVSGVLQDPSTYGVVGNTLTFSTAPPPGTGNISCRYLGVPVTGITTTAYRTVTEFTATAGQTTFTPPSYTVGFISVFLNGVLLGSADYTATNGTTVVLATGASVGNLVTVESLLVSSVLNAIPNTAGAVSSSNIQTSVALTTPTIDKINTSVTNTSLGAGNASIMKNRIINGAMVINQRAFSGNVATDGAYTLDRWLLRSDLANKLAISQSSTAPVGFNYSLQVTTATAVASPAYYMLSQYLEGFNTADLNWGTANAKTVTLSFWVQSSLTGTFGGSITNGAENYSYPFSYTISAANTWEQKSVTITGPTAGTWIGATNGKGMNLYFGLGVVSTYSGTAGAWAATGYYSTTGAVSVVSTAGATWYVTGVQLEVGSSATGYEYVNYQTLLANCQRYYWRKNASSYGTPSQLIVANLTAYTGTAVWGKWLDLPVQQRTAGTTSWSSVTHFLAYNGSASGGYNFTSGTVPTSDGQSLFSWSSSTASSAGFTAGQVAVTLFNTSSGWLASDAEL
jgi:hypothetical protein